MADFRDVNVDELAHLISDRAITGETMLLNMGPQHPSTHGVLRLLLELDGEIVVNCIPDIGYLHTGVEKNMEAKTYEKAEVMTDRLDYQQPIANNLVYCLAVEKLAELDVPPRAQVMRVILAELTRIASHLIWVGTSALDLGANTLFMYTMIEREKIFDIFELCSGQRMMTTYIRPGGLWRDVPRGFEDALTSFLTEFPPKADEFENFLEKSLLFNDRTKGIGVITAEQCMEWGLSGPVLRASGVSYDIRKAYPYSGYEQYVFDIPVFTGGDVHDRFKVRMEEIRQSLSIIRQAFHNLPFGPVRSNNRKYVPPPRSELGTSMEALIHHFKLWTEGFSPPKGSVYAAIETAKGEMGVYLESNGGPKPYRVKYRTPSFLNLQVMPLLTRGAFVADVVGIIGSIDIVLGETDR